ncbi:Rossman fold protein, TIGR00730 family [bacterium F11]|nr:Rossman fold protein, TIGR00730 family [bacterium F11]
MQGQIQTLVKSIMPNGSTSMNADVVQEIMVTALKAAQSHISRLDLKILSRAVRELRYAFKIFRGYRDIRKVTIFGSARTKTNHLAYKTAKDFAKKITARGYMAITGAGPGIMQAGNEGSLPNKSFGINIRLPFEQYPNKFIAHQPTYIDCRYFFTRKLVFVKETNAVVVFPGGLGTLDEAFEVLTLVQTGKSDPMPIVFVDSPKGTMWDSLHSFLKNRLLRLKMISKEDLSLYRIVDNANEAVKEIMRFYSNYHSIRYVKDSLVIRIHNVLSERQLRYINHHFRDILSSGSFRASGPLKEEENQPEIAHLPRLIGKFNRVNNGRLRELIDYLNRSE